MPLLIPYQLTVLSTSRCTARCAHCSVRSAPERRDQLSLRQIIDTIGSLHGRYGLKVVIFAGGEPTLLGNDLLDAIAHADGMGIITRLVTNASWATTPPRARRQLVEFREAGLAELNLSADDYHLPFIPFVRVKNAWCASKGLGFRAVVIANCSGPRSTVTPEFIKRELGEDLALRFDDRGMSQPQPPAAADGTVYSLSNSRLQRLGRAHDRLSAADFLHLTDGERLSGGCPWAVRSPALSPTGHLVACCGMEAEHNAILDFGDARTTSPEALIDRADDSVIVNAIALLGPAYLKEFVRARDADVPFRDSYASVCELCEDIVSRENTVEVLRLHAGALARDVLAERNRLRESEA